ncbi:uncharacterized protein BDW47DRAFT_113033 [Aspergillus candidus]|uniref:Central kinetochore-associated-domain-containing protein n=1 Tax=Aspergillus candidus TaxID=41067 RepID=A0A2I2F008_ASPCN|nr:hypothetical protein BDW47DRAFT_113033 [Aspergillus candidus]PLB33966.1 hypothetical protein BDW47DRAFT_113033 [Aspergillus candidus]
MPTVLSPLASSRQNSRTQSPRVSDLGVDKSGNYEDENSAFSSPKKAVDDYTNANDQMSYDAAYESGADREHIDESAHVTSSSPSMYDAPERVSDFQPLRNRQLSAATTELSATPRKRSYEILPGDVGVDEDTDERHKKGKDDSEISIFADEDSRIAENQDFDMARKDIGNSVLEEKLNEGMSSVLQRDHDEASGERENTDLQERNDDPDTTMDDSYDAMEDTHLSTFSAVPNVDMTCFADLKRNSPTKGAGPLPKSPSKVDDLGVSTPPRKSPRKGTLLDFSSPAASPTPRKREPRDLERGSGTPNLLDIADQHDFFPRRRYSVQKERYSPSRRSPLRTVRESLRSPAKISLLDFDIPAAPTPRSIPTVTPRELESLKSGFMSEISSLKATLSGKEAEVASLKQAIADAERRVGEALEEVRNEAARKEALEIDQAEWQRRGQEMEDVLRTVRAEIVEGEQEKERLLQRVEEAEKSRDQLESRVVEIETQLTAARRSAPSDVGSSERSRTAEETANEVQDAVEKVARELHTLYKSKHETKVAALKKSYEARWEKRVRDAEKKFKTAAEENERLKVERDHAMSEAARPDSSLLVHEKDEHEADKRVLEAQIKGLQQEMAALKDDGERVRMELKMERAEKGELVAAVDEWLSIQAQQQQPPAPSETQSPPPSREIESPEPVESEPAVEAPRRSVSVSRGGPSGIRLPSTGVTPGGEKRVPNKIPTPGNRHGRGNSGGKSGIAVFTPGRAGIMGSIERMGRGA